MVCLEEEEVGNPLVVGVVHSVGLRESRGHSGVRPIPSSRQGERVGDVAVGVERGLADLALVRIPVVRRVS